MTATLHALPIPGLQDIPKMLRNLADDIAAGKYGEVSEAAVVLGSDKLDVFGFGAADATVAHYLLACAQRKLEAPRIG